MNDVIHLDEHRATPGTLWWSGVARCTSCGHEHVAVAPFPAWALGPGTMECPGCHQVAALAVHEEAPCPT